MGLWRVENGKMTKLHDREVVHLIALGKPYGGQCLGMRRKAACGVWATPKLNLRMKMPRQWYDDKTVLPKNICPQCYEVRTARRKKWNPRIRYAHLRRPGARREPLAICGRYVYEKILYREVAGARASGMPVCEQCVRGIGGKVAHIAGASGRARCGASFPWQLVHAPIDEPMCSDCLELWASDYGAGPTERVS